MRRLVMIFGALSCLLAACAFTGWVRSSPKVVSVDLARIKGQFIAQCARHAASSEQVATASTRFNRALKLVLNQYATQEQVVIIERQYVLLGAQDATDELIVLLASAMSTAS